MFNKLRKVLINDGIKRPAYQQIFKNVIGYGVCCNIHNVTNILIIMYGYYTYHQDPISSWDYNGEKCQILYADLWINSH